MTDTPAIARLRAARQALEVECLRIHGVGYGAIDHCGRCGYQLNNVWDALDDLLNGTVTVRMPKPAPVPPPKKWYQKLAEWL